ncbi:hypothetical protein PENSPDRAFT_590239, partial [Peniophora sp. CONT]
GSDWEDPRAIEAIADLMPSMSNLRPVLVRGLIKARDNWKKFSDDFAPGSQIDLLTAVERVLGYMPPENDDNESLLGQFRLFTRQYPNALARTFTAGVTYAHNDTEAFSERYLTADAIQTYIMQLARKQDASGEAKKFRLALLKHEAEKARVTQEKRTIRDTAKREERDRLMELVVVVDKADVRAPGMTKKKLCEQLNWHKVIREDKKVPALSKFNKAALEGLLCDALDRMAM